MAKNLNVLLLLLFCVSYFVTCYCGNAIRKRSQQANYDSVGIFTAFENKAKSLCKLYGASKYAIKMTYCLNERGLCMSGVLLIVVLRRAYDRRKADLSR